MKSIVALFLLAAAAPLSAAVPVTPLVGPKPYFTDSNGKPCSGCKFWTYAAGTTTPQLSYSDPGGSVANTNPVILDSAGHANAFITGSPYKFVLETAIGTPHGTVLWTQDNYTAGSIAGVVFPIVVANGGTGDSTLPANNLLIGNGTAPITGLSPTGNQLKYVRSKPNVATPIFELAALPIVSAPDYDFTAQPGSTIVIGANTVTLSPVPLGINGTNTKHYLYISGGTGSAELVLITGGSAASGGTVGTIQFTAANAHSGAYTITSATNGRTEAEYALLGSSPNGGTVYMPADSYTYRAATPFMQNVRFLGAGTGTRLIPASSSTIAFDSNLPVKATTEANIHEDNVSFQNFLIDGGSFAGVNTLYGIRQTNLPGSTELFSIAGITIDTVWFNNVANAIHLERSYKANILNCKLYENSAILLTDSQTTNGFHNTYTTIDNLEYIWPLLIGDGTQVSMMPAVITAISCEVFYVTNSRFAGRPTVNTAAINVVGGEDFKVFNSEFSSWYNVLQLSKTAYGSGPNFYPGYIVFSGNSVDAIWHGAFNMQAGSSGTSGAQNQVSHVLIASNIFTNAFNVSANPIFVEITSFTKHVALTGNLFYGLDTGDIGVSIANGADDIRFDKSNIFTNQDFVSTPTTTAVFIDPAAGGVYGLEQLNPLGFDVSINDAAATVASASTITLPLGRTQVTVTGVTNVTSITAQPKGTIVTLSIPGALTFVNGSNLKIGATFTATGVATGTLTLLCDGTNWIKLSAAAN